MANAATDAWQTSVLVPSQHIDETDQISNFDPLAQDDTTMHRDAHGDTKQHNDDDGQRVLYSPNVTDVHLDHGHEQKEEEELHNHYHDHDHEIETSTADSGTTSFPEPILSLDGLSESYQNVNPYMQTPVPMTTAPIPVSFIYTVANAVTNVVDALAKEDEDVDGRVEQAPSHRVYHTGLSEQKRLVLVREQDNEKKDDGETETINEQGDTEFTIAAIEPPEQSEDFDAHAPDPVDTEAEEKQIEQDRLNFEKKISTLTRRNVVARTFVESKRVLSNTMSSILTLASLGKKTFKSGTFETNDTKKHDREYNKSNDIPAEVWPEETPRSRTGVGHRAPAPGYSQEWVIDYRALRIRAAKLFCHVWTMRVCVAIIILCAACLSWITFRLHVEHPIVIHVAEPTCARYSASDRLDNLHEQIGHDIELYLEQHPQELCATALEIGYNKRHLVIRTHVKHIHRVAKEEAEQGLDMVMSSRYLHLVHFDIAPWPDGQVDDPRIIHFSQNETASHCRDDEQPLIKYTKRRCPIDVTYDSWPEFETSHFKAMNNATAICVQHYWDVCNDLWPCDRGDRGVAPMTR